MVYDSLLLEDMVHWQMAHMWGVMAQPIAFFVFFTAAIAETKRIPFDLPEAESELVSGYFTEYSGMKFGMFFMGEFVEGHHQLAHRDAVPRRPAVPRNCSPTSSVWWACALSGDALVVVRLKLVVSSGCS
jgi:hypothetical protein